MKIIYYSPHPTHDIVSEVGYATHQREVINALKELGHTVIPIIMGGIEPNNLSKAGIPAENNSLKSKIKKLVPKFIWTSLKDLKLMQHDKNAARKLEEAIVKHKPDLVYERSEYLQDAGVSVIRKHNVKYCLEINAPFIEEMKGFEGSSIWHKLAHKKEKNKIQKADKIIVVSTALKEFIIKKYCAKEDDIIIQPNCINISKITINTEKVDEIKLKYDFKNYKVIGFVGSILPHHGVDILIDAFNLVLQKDNNIKLLIVGDGSIVDQLKSKIEKLGISNKIIFTGKISHSLVFNYIQCMDICVMAKSNWYGSPIKIFEYAAIGKPVIAPETPAVLDVMEHLKTGYITKMNAHELAEGIHFALNNSELSALWAANFKNKVMAEFTWDKAAQKIIEICA